MTKVKKYFPGALTLAQLEKKVTKILKKYGIIPENTLLCFSTCADEIENKIERQFDKVWNYGFAGGGLAGFFFTQRTGFDAALAHVPDHGNMLLVYCSHVGITKKGKLGYVERRGMKNPSTCCGAAIGAYHGGEKRENDHQQNYIIDVVDQYRDQFRENEQENMVILSTIIAKQIQEDLEIPKTNIPIVLLGGININTKGEDYFQVQQFEIIKNGKKYNLMDRL